MKIYRHLYTIITICICISLAHEQDCSRASYTRCVSLADPLLKDAQLIFPDNMHDIELVCLTWNSFVDCLKGYTDRCFTREQRRQFNKAVENPIESVHMMCTQQHYQQEYLQHASCIKSTVTEHDHCGDQYSQLVDQVSQGEAISRASLCCSHDKFRRCVMKEAQRLCDRGNPNGNAVRFAEQIIDKALSFLQDQCYNYIPNSADCLSPIPKSSDDQLAMSTSPWLTSRGRDTYLPSASSTSNGAFNSGANSAGYGKEHRGPVNDVLSTDVTVLELGGGGELGGDRVTNQWVATGGVGGRGDRDEGSTTGTMLGSRTRPSSYGRSSSWDTSPSPSPPGPTLAATPSPRPDWSTLYNTGNTGNTAGNTASNTVPGSSNSGATGGSSAGTWTAGNGGGYSGSQSTNVATNPISSSSFFTNTNTRPQQTTTETWYPAAGSHVGNAVDEPNQLGLAKPKNGATVPKVLAVQLSFTVVATVLVAYC